MKSYTLIANMDRRQYIDPFYFNEDGNLYGNYLSGIHIQALAMLVCQKNNTGTYTERPSSLEGSWSGDQIMLASSEMYPNLMGYQTATEDQPNRNLYDVIEGEFENISQTMLVLLAQADQAFGARLLAEVSPNDHHFLRILGDALSQHHSSSLQDAVAKRFGPDWMSKYQEQKLLEAQELLDED